MVLKDHVPLISSLEAGRISFMSSGVEECVDILYGSYVIATPEALLDMMNDGLLLHVHLMDAKIGI